LGVLIVLKYGGNAMAALEDDLVLDDCATRIRSGDRIVIVHGGGPQIDAALAERGIGQERIEGLRVTDAATLAVTEAVLCGNVNKALVRALATRDVRAVGISGEDGALLVAQPRAPIRGASLGYVGEIVAVRTELLDVLLAAGFTPVVAPLGATRYGSQALNINADTAAGAIAGALAADAFVIVTNVERVRRRIEDPKSGIARLLASEARDLLADGTFDGGMVPKMESALAALDAGARSVAIGGSGRGALSAALAGGGTTLIAG
jgi:acetylglutamate kinase